MFTKQLPIMKSLFVLLLLLSFGASAQQLDVLLIGVSHNYGKYPKQDFSDIHKKIEAFKPTAFFGEFLSMEDEKNLMDYWCKKDNLKRLEMLRKNRNIPLELLPKWTDSLKKLALAKPDNYGLKTDLAHAYYLSQDVSNGHYQYWQVFEHLRQKPDAELSDYVRMVLSPELDNTGRSMTRLQTSEYAVIAFPMMLKLGIKELIPMDNQDYDLNWNKSWEVSDAKFQDFKKDTSVAFQTKFKAISNKINQGFAKYDNVEKSSNKITEWLNTDEAGAIATSGDFYLSEMYDMKGFPKEEMLSKIHWWLMRNQGMCDNVVNRAKAIGAKRVVVIAGANHRKYMQDIFAKMPGVKVRNITSP